MQFASQILSNVEIAPDYWRIRLTAPREFAEAEPGQFVMVRVAGGIDPLLRRPLAVFDLGMHETGGVPQVWFEMLYKVVGKGTALLSSLREGNDVDILGPLGTGFDMGSDDEEKLLVGGGIGLAPLYLLATELVRRKSPVHLFAGGRTHHDLLCLADFERLGVKCHCATEDGSYGAKGFVTVALNRHLDALAGKATLYACGPDGMLHALAKIAAERRLPCQVSLEGYMACGVGACLACTCGAANGGSRQVCKDGPVFWAEEVGWS